VIPVYDFFSQTMTPISSTKSTARRIRNIGVKPNLTVFTMNMISMTGRAIAMIASAIAMNM
jgi:hypothetical protein